MIIDHIYEWARVNPNRTAVIYNDVAISYGEFAKSIERTRQFLTRQQLSQGSTAALLIQNLLGCWIVCIALRAIGLNTIPLKTVPQAQQVQIRQPSCLVMLDTEVGDLEIPSNINARVIVVPQTIYANVQECELPAPLGTNSLYGDHILYTSGTTGTHKKLLWCAHDEDRRAAARGAFYKFDARTVLHVLNYALWTGAGFRGCLWAWMFGGCVIIDGTKERFSKFFQHDVTNSVLLPSMLDQVLVTCKTRSGTSEPKLDVGGSLAKRKQILRAIDLLTCKVTVGYFCTELILPPLISSVRSEDDVEWLLPQADRDISIVKGDRVVNGINEEGFLRIALTDLDSNSYYEEAGKSAFAGEYFYPGDMAVRRADARIRILGRVDDVINLQGRKVAVAAIEQNLQQHLEADEVCLFGGLNDVGQEELIVAIQSSSHPSQTKLDDVRKQFKGFEVVRFHVLEQFPRTETGKVRRIMLKNRLTRGQ